VKIALITDTHIGARNDSQVFSDYFADFYNNVFFPYLDDHSIDTVVHLGDIVDRRKYISYITLRAFRDYFVQPMADRNIDFHCIVGNHDIPYRNTNDINAMREIFDGSIGKIYWEPQEVSFDGLKILMMPWINNANYNTALTTMQKTDAQVMFGHFEIAGFEMMRGQTCDHGMDVKHFRKFDMVLSGHFHHKSTMGNITYLGNPYELTWGDYDDPRGFHILDTDTRELEFIKNPYRMFHKVFYDDETYDLEQLMNLDFEHLRNRYIKVVVVKKQNPYWFDQFLDRLYKCDPTHLTIVEDNKHLDLEKDEEIMDAEDTLTILNKYVDALEVDIDKKQLSGLLNNLYTEALYIE
jgi:DNA repair exonuclease SbcCD nuclease subunit